MNFHFEVEADLLEASLIDLLVQMPRGRVQLEIGIQSTSPEALQACGRTARLDRVFHNVRRLTAAGNLNIHVDLIAGLPTETYLRFQESFSEVYRLGAHQLQLGFLKLLTGAPMNKLIKPYGYVFSEHPPYEILKNDCISAEELFKLKCVEDVLERLYNSGRFRRFLAALESGYASPFAMMEAVAGRFREKGLIFQSLGLNELCDEMALFCRQQILDQSKQQQLMEALLLDFYTATPSDRVPKQLQELSAGPTISPKEKRFMAAALLRQIGRRDRKIVIRFCRRKPVAIDYTERDPVTGQFECIDIKNSHPE